MSIIALGLLVAVGSGFEDTDMGSEYLGGPSTDPGNGPDFNGYGGYHDSDGHGDYHDSDGHDGYHDSDGHGGYHDSDGHGGYHDNYDWLNPGGYYSYSSWYYPSYSYYWYPSYAYTYPVAYTAPVVYPAYNYYYDPVVYDPWYAANVYGWTGSTYYYSSSWSWSRYGGYYFV
jgi:hypothetical protein